MLQSIGFGDGLRLKQCFERSGRGFGISSGLLDELLEVVVMHSDNNTTTSNSDWRFHHLFLSKILGNAAAQTIRIR